jgi:hypothetical protein
MYNVIIKRHVAAFNTDSLNRAAVCESNIPNGAVVTLTGKSENEGESRVWVAEAPASGDAAGLWMAASPEVVTLTDALGNEYKGLTADPRAFVNIAGKTMDVFKPQKSDIIWMALTDVVGTINETNKYLVPTGDGSAFTLTASSTAGDGLCFQLIGERAIEIPNGNVVKNLVTGYEFECINN